MSITITDRPTTDDYAAVATLADKVDAIYWDGVAAIERDPSRSPFTVAALAVLVEQADTLAAAARLLADDAAPEDRACAYGADRAERYAKALRSIA